MSVARNLIGTLVLLLSVAAVSAAEGRVERSFEVSPGGTLYLEATRGSVEVEAWSENRVRVDLLYKKRGSTSQQLEDLFAKLNPRIESDGTDVWINIQTSREDETWLDWLGWGKRLDFEFKINVPSSYNLEVQTSGGSIAVGDLSGEVNVKTSGGGIRLGEINGPVLAKTSGGSIKLAASSADAELKTSGGGITVGLVNGRVTARTSGGTIRVDETRGDLSARTSGGGIHLGDISGVVDAQTSGGSISARLLSQPARDCRLSTSGGRVEVYLASDLALEIDASAGGGRVHSDLPVVAAYEKNRSRLAGELNGGGPALKLRTSGGSIYIRQH